MGLVLIRDIKGFVFHGDSDDPEAQIECFGGDSEQDGGALGAVMESVFEQTDLENLEKRNFLHIGRFSLELPDSTADIITVDYFELSVGRRIVESAVYPIVRIADSDISDSTDRMAPETAAIFEHY